MVNVEITNGTGMFEKSKRAGFLARIEKVASTDQLQKLELQSVS